MNSKHKASHAIDPASPFADVSRDPAGHFSLHVYVAIFWIIHYMRAVADLTGEDGEDALKDYPFLAGYFAEMSPRLPPGLTWPEGPGWWQQQIGAWECKISGHLPLATLGNASTGEFARRIGFVLAGLVEEDSRFGTLFAALQSPIPHRRPTLELLTQITERNWALPGRAMELYKGLIHDGLLVPESRDAPRAEWLLRVPPPLWDAAQSNAPEQVLHTGRSDIQVDFRPVADFAPLEQLVLTEHIHNQLRHLPTLLQTRQIETIVLRSTPGSGRIQVMGAVAQGVGCGLLIADGVPEQHTHQQFGPLARLTNSIPVFTYDLTPGESVALPRLTGYQGPVGILIGQEGGVSSTSLQRIVTITLPKPALAERRQIWQQAFGTHPVVELDAICERFQLPENYIHQAAAVAMTTAALAGRQQVSVDDVRTACRTLNRQKLDTLATYLDAGGTWNHLVVGELAADKLRELETRCRHRERLLQHLGPAFHGNANRGVRALFNGPSGTGKTLAAKILSAELGKDLYRVDLAAVVNKYIGETEKNLHQILVHAEELDVILLLDEGDSLLGSRTDVKSANDRYANLETNFLLQRLETYQGIVLVTTNVGDHIDTAFQRRMDVVVNFTLPQAQERWYIWQLHLPTGHAVSAAYLETVAVRCDLTGGQIRNAALHATLLALDAALDPTDAGAAQVTDYHLAAALRSEYRKAGASFPLGESLTHPVHYNGHTQGDHHENYRGNPTGMAAFLEQLA